MAKGYWIGHVDVYDNDAYMKYVEANAAAFGKYGARFLVRGGDFDCVEGKTRARNVVIEFPSIEAARECYSSPEYKNAITFRSGPVAKADLVIIEGYEG
jgi:uncharacterized protein (DUF1330 family)